MENNNFNSEIQFVKLFSQIMGKPVEILEINFSGINGLEDPTWKYCQFVTNNPDGTRSRYEVGIVNGEVFFDLYDEVYEED